MKNTNKNLEKRVADITKKVVDYIMKLNEEQIVIKAICCEKFSESESSINNSNIDRYIIIGKDFPCLSTREKLLVIKSAIHTHYRLTNGIVIGTGKICGYELQFTKKYIEYKILFTTDGTLLEENMELYI